MKDKDKIWDDKKWDSRIKWLLWAGICSLAMCYFIPFLIIHLFPLEQTREFFFGNESSQKTTSDIIGTLGTVGDWFGGTTVPLLTFLSFIGIIFALMMQRRELGLQMVELKETREVFMIQRFENTFFNMINLHNDIVRNIKVDEKPKNINNREVYPADSGRDAFENLYERFILSKYSIYVDRAELLTEMNEAYEDFYKEHQPLIGHYFRNLYRITKFIDEQHTLSSTEKENYIGILKAQLSTYELLLIFYNALSDYGSKRFLPLIKRYDLLDNMNRDLLKRTHFDYNDYLMYKDKFEETKIQIIAKEIKNFDLRLFEESKKKVILTTAEICLGLDRRKPTVVEEITRAFDNIEKLLKSDYLKEREKDAFKLIIFYKFNLLEIIDPKHEYVKKKNDFFSQH